MSASAWLPAEDELLQLAVRSYGPDWSRIASILTGRSAAQCQTRYESSTRGAASNNGAAASSAASAAPAAAAASPNSIIPASGISHIAKLLFVTAKLYTRNLLSSEEKRVLKQLSVRSDPALLSIDLSGENFLTQLIDTASSVAISGASSTFHNVLYRHCSTNHGKQLSKNERKSKGIVDNSFVYGEIDFHSFSQVIKEIRPLIKPDGVFVDLGSGTGRPCFAMALLSDMREIVGIEYLADLIEASREVQQVYETYLESDEIEVEASSGEETEEAAPASGATGANGSPLRVQTKRRTKVLNSPLAKLERKQKQAGAGGDGEEEAHKRVRFIQGDFLTVDWWSRSDFVFLNSTCYSPALIAGVSALAERLAPGSIVVSLTKSLNSQQFQTLSKKKYLMSWGSATAYVQKRM